MAATTTTTTTSMDATTTPREPKQATFLLLPAEIRNQIYTHTFLQIPHCFYQRDSGRRHVMGDDHLKMPALSQVSRQIWTESLALFYGDSDCHVQLWPKSLDRGGPDLGWLGPAESSRMRMFGRVKITSEIFSLVIVQSDMGRNIKLETLKFHRQPPPSPAFLARIREHITAGLDFIATGAHATTDRTLSTPGFSPRLLKHLIRYMLYAIAEQDSANTLPNHDTIAFLARHAKLSTGRRALVQGLLALTPMKGVA